MEAVGAAGAIVGLAGSALTGLKHLNDFITVLRDGQIDLSTAQRRLAEHESRLLELRNDYNSLRNSSITDEENALLDSCIKDSYEELKGYRTRLEKMAKTRTRGKSLQRVETAVRMFLSEEDVKKHKSLLQDRIFRLEQFSERVNRVRVNESFQSIRSAATQFHAEDMTMHSQISSALEAASEARERQLQQLSNMQSFWVAHMTAVIEEHNQETRTLIQSSSHSSVLEMKKNMEQTFQTMQLAVRNKDRISQKQQRNSRHLLHDIRDHGHNGADQEVLFPSIFHANVYRTPFGRLRVSRNRMDRYTTGQNHGGPWRVMFRIRFEPYRCFSLKFVEWTCHLTMGINDPSVKIESKMGVLCEDDEVLEALGLIRKPFCGYFFCEIDINGCPKHKKTCESWWWRTKLPSPGKLRRLLDERRFGPHDSLRHAFQKTSSILSVFALHHRLCEQTREQTRADYDNARCGIQYYDMPRCYAAARHLNMEDGWDAERDVVDTRLTKTSEDFDNLARFYPAYYEMLEMLLEIGCRPDRDDWRPVQWAITERYCHILEMHPQYASSDYFQLYSAMKLVRNAAACATMIMRPQWRPYGFSNMPTMLWVGYLGHLLPFRNCIQEMSETLFDIGGLDAVDKELVYDRWFLVLMIHIKPELRTLITGNAGYRTSAGFTIERVCSEIQKAPLDTKFIVTQYVIHYGNAVLVQLLVENGIDIGLIFKSAAEGGVPEIFDFILDSHLERIPVSELKRQLSQPMMQRRISRDSGFVDRLLNLKFLPRQWEPSQKYADHLLGDADGFILNRDHVMQPLIRKGPTESLGSIDIMVDCFIFRYEQEHCRFPEGLRLYLQYGMFATTQYSNFWRQEDVGSRARAFHQVLRRLSASSVFGCGLEYAPRDSSPLDHVAATKGYTPLMVALYAGMIPAIEVLISAGAEITKCAPCGLSALQLAEQNAQGKHPRAYKTSNPYCQSIGGMKKSGRTGLVSCNSDETMLEMLRDALRSRGVEVPEPGLPKVNLEPPPYRPRKASWRFGERIETLLTWLFKPTVVISIEGLRDRVLDIVVVCTFTFLSIARLLQKDAENFVSLVKWALKLLSRPVVMVFIVAWTFTTLWRHFVTAT
ncbi:hypothetical protein PFICI_13594 [Pestalotiopsis fici W106-1]|uniref:Uncharacterized protein n=1 Tax=Pestalotiopsis fici (strain W106-1 / CGMCC3.15140) TaxID=1229662 RepID=W3WMG8_PESFW|nr:uncharacterized protein PFICI_13594 [Pestalotiopsis fici W106-1]ETS75110.1 hypothetical protein PFICI_13594 [Pestalotiopsis fici W106-1]